MSEWGYAALCVVVPAVWGILMYYAFGALDRRRRNLSKRGDPPPVDYSI